MSLFMLSYSDWKGSIRDKVACPNGCGQLIILKTRTPVQYLLNEDLNDAILENQELCDAPEEVFGFIAAICPTCGFVVLTETKYSPEEYEERLEGYMHLQEVQA